MMAMAARSFGYKINVLDPDPNCPAAYVVDKVIEASWADDWEAGNLARGCDVVTLEIEQISPASMAMASRFAPVRPSRRTGCRRWAFLSGRFAECIVWIN
jgi:5-(carboxyamino)imidazole ribonucleotide synthase